MFKILISAAFLFLLIIGSSATPYLVELIRQKQYVDKNARLSWQYCSPYPFGCPQPLLLNWSQALNYCQQLTWDQQQNWRLPNRNELISLINWNQRTPAITSRLKETTKNSVYWSSTTDLEHPEKAYYSSFFSGFSYPNYKIVQGYVRCVRNLD